MRLSQQPTFHSRLLSRGRARPLRRGREIWRLKKEALSFPLSVVGDGKIKALKTMGKKECVPPLSSFMGSSPPLSTWGKKFTEVQRHFLPDSATFYTIKAHFSTKMGEFRPSLMSFQVKRSLSKTPNGALSRLDSSLPSLLTPQLPPPAH